MQVLGELIDKKDKELKRVYGNTSKEVYSLSIDNDYSVNGITKAMVYDFYAGTDFLYMSGPSEGGNRKE